MEPKRSGRCCIGALRGSGPVRHGYMFGYYMCYPGVEAMSLWSERKIENRTAAIFHFIWSSMNNVMNSNNGVK